MAKRTVAQATNNEADDTVPFSLFTYTGRNELPPDLQSHTCAFLASIMGEFHNTLFRCFNNLYRQAPGVSAHDPHRATNFLRYTEILCELIHTHHDWEEEEYFPALEQFAGKPGLLRVNVVQHEAFEAGLQNFHDYVKGCSGRDYDAATYRRMMMEFAPPFEVHMKAEPGTFLALRDTDSEGLMNVYKEQEKIAMAKGDLFQLLPMVLGSCDNSFHIDDLVKPLHPTPWFLPYMVHYITSWRYSGLWEFNVSDFWGNPKSESVMGGQGKKRV